MTFAISPNVYCAANHAPRTAGTSYGVPMVAQLAGFIWGDFSERVFDPFCGSGTIGGSHWLTKAVSPPQHADYDIDLVCYLPFSAGTSHASPRLMPCNRTQIEHIDVDISLRPLAKGDLSTKELKSEFKKYNERLWNSAHELAHFYTYRQQDVRELFQDTFDHTTWVDRERFADYFIRIFARTTGSLSPTVSLLEKLRALSLRRRLEIYDDVTAYLLLGFCPAIDPDRFCGILHTGVTRDDESATRSTRPRRAASIRSTRARILNFELITGISPPASKDFTLAEATSLPPSICGENYASIIPRSSHRKRMPDWLSQGPPRGRRASRPIRIPGRASRTFARGAQNT